MMKKLFFLSAILFFAITAFSQSRASYTSTGGGGNWGASTTWSPSGVPVDGDDVTISSGNPVTVASPNSRAASTITVNTGATLTVSSGATLTTSGNITVNGTLAQNGTLTVGDAVTDNLTIDGSVALLDIGDGSTTNVAGYYSQINSSRIQSSSGVTASINFATAGALNDNTNPVLNFQNGSVANFNGSAVNFWIKDGNNGTAPEIFIGNPGFTSAWTGTVTFGMGTSTTVTDWTAKMEYGTGFYKPIIDIGTGNVFHLVQTTFQNGAQITFTRMDLNSGTFIVEPLTDLLVTSGTGIGMNGGLLEINSDVTGTGELQFNGSTATLATVKQFIVGNDWHQITPSTTGMTTADVFQNYSPNVWLIQFNTTTQAWEYITDPALTQALNVGQGYVVYGQQLARTDDFTITTNGNLRSTDFPITGIGSALNDKQLIGNPFSSSYNVDNALIASTNLYSEIWVWDAVNDNYATYTVGTGGTHNGKVANGQGFFVETNNAAGGGSITLTAADRDFNINDNFYKSDDLLNWDNNFGKNIYAMIKVSDGSRTDAAFINFGETGTRGFEDGYDGFKMFGDDGSPQLYLVENDMQLSIDYLKTMDLNEKRVVQLNLQPGITGEHTIAINLDSLSGTQVMLEDKFLNKMHDLNEDPFYTFNANKEDDPARFVLHFNFNATGIDNPSVEQNTIKVYAWDKAIYISNSENDFSEATIHVYDLLGRELVNTKANLGNLTRIPVQVNNSYLVVQVIKGSNVVTQKVFVK